MSGKSRVASTLYVRRLGLHHLAYLRAVADGIDPQVAAKMYLGVEHGHEAVTAHRRVVDHLRGVARRRGDRDWRLIGMAIGRNRGGERAQPSLEDWAAERGLDDGWSEAELLEMYQEAYPADRKDARNSRLRERQFKLLNELQHHVAQAPKPTDPIDGWFDPLTADRLRASGLLMLGELQQAIARGGRWWSAIPKIGPEKARRIEGFLQTICGGPAASARPASAVDQAIGALSVAPGDFVQVAAAAPVAGLPSPALPSPALRLGGLAAADLDGSAGVNRSVSRPAALAANNDRQAIERWIQARASNSAGTATAYRREAERLLLWCLVERQKPLSSMVVEDCLAYMAFLERIPDDWISRRRVERLQPGWAPFSGQLSASSRRQALAVVGALFEWLRRTGYLELNPWVLVNRRIPDEPGKSVFDSRAFTRPAWREIRNFLVSQPPSPALARTLFILDFGQASGLRASELLRAKIGDLQAVGGLWAVKVVGKGSKERTSAVPSSAVAALQRYLAARGLPPLPACPADLPLVASALDPCEPVGYQALYKSTKAWFGRAIRQADLPMSEKTSLYKASLHWLRHTCGTRALERGVSIHIVQQQLGHADPRTTMRYSKAQLQELLEGMEQGLGE